MVVFLFLGSVITLELILHFDAKAQKRLGKSRRTLPAPSATVPVPFGAAPAGTHSMVALMNALEKHGPTVKPENPVTEPETEAVCQQETHHAL